MGKGSIVICTLDISLKIKQVIELIFDSVGV